ncbi:MAG: ATP-binding protein, partial [Sediminispirochaetaceae bacterium]
MKRDSAELIAPNIYWIGAEDSYNHLHCNTYLITDGEEGILIDPGPVMTFPTVAERVRSIIPIEKLS